MTEFFDILVWLAVSDNKKSLETIALVFGITSLAAFGALKLSDYIV